MMQFNITSCYLLCLATLSRALRRGVASVLTEMWLDWEVWLGCTFSTDLQQSSTAAGDTISPSSLTAMELPSSLGVRNSTGTSEDGVTFSVATAPPTLLPCGPPE